VDLQQRDYWTGVVEEVDIRDLCARLSFELEPDMDDWYSVAMSPYDPGIVDWSAIEYDSDYGSDSDVDQSVEVSEAPEWFPQSNELIEVLFGDQWDTSQVEQTKQHISSAYVEFDGDPYVQWLVPYDRS